MTRNCRRNVPTLKDLSKNQQEPLIHCCVVAIQITITAEIELNFMAFEFRAKVYNLGNIGQPISVSLCLFLFSLLSSLSLSLSLSVCVCVCVCLCVCVMQKDYDKSLGSKVFRLRNGKRYLCVCV